MSTSTETIPRARAGHPQTSHDAAASVTKLGEKQNDVLLVIKTITGSCTLEELVETYDGVVNVAEQSPSGIRSRCSELVKLGLVENSGERRKTRSGRAAIVWRIRT